MHANATEPAQPKEMKFNEKNSVANELEMWTLTKAKEQNETTKKFTKHVENKKKCRKTEKEFSFFFFFFCEKLSAENTKA